MGGDIIEKIFHRQIAGRCECLLIEEGGRKDGMEVTKIISFKTLSDIYSNNCFFRVLRLLSIQCLLSFREG